MTKMTKMTKFVICLILEGDPKMAHEAVEAALDAETLQSYIDDCLPIGETVRIKSIVVRSDPDRLDDKCHS